MPPITLERLENEQNTNEIRLTFRYEISGLGTLTKEEPKYRLSYESFKYEKTLNFLNNELIEYVPMGLYHYWNRKRIHIDYDSINLSNNQLVIRKEFDPEEMEMFEVDNPNDLVPCYINDITYLKGHHRWHEDRAISNSQETGFIFLNFFQIFLKSLTTTHRYTVDLLQTIDEKKVDDLHIYTSKNQGSPLYDWGYTKDQYTSKNLKVAIYAGIMWNLLIHQTNDWLHSKWIELLDKDMLYVLYPMIGINKEMLELNRDLPSFFDLIASTDSCWLEDCKWECWFQDSQGEIKSIKPLTYESGITIGFFVDVNKKGYQYSSTYDKAQVKFLYKDQVYLTSECIDLHSKF